VYHPFSFFQFMQKGNYRKNDIILKEKNKRVQRERLPQYTLLLIVRFALSNAEGLAVAPLPAIPKKKRSVFFYSEFQLLHE